MSAGGYTNNVIYRNVREVRSRVWFWSAILDRQNNQVSLVLSALSTVISDSLYFQICQLYCESESESANRNKAYDENDQAVS